MGLVDVHAHLTDARLAADEAAVLQRARDAGVSTIIANGLNPADNAAVHALAQRAPMVRAAFGFYPVDAVLAEMRARGVDYREGDVASADEGIAWVRANAATAIAIGEIGLDGHWVPEPLWARQEEVFRALLAIALDFDKPIIVHTRRRERRCLEILSEMNVTRVNWHCFGGKVTLARSIAERGHLLSIPANARRSESFTRMLETLPHESLLLETDCPYLSPDRARPSEPADVAGTARYAAELWGVSLTQVTAQIEDNFARLFRVEP